LKKPKEGQWGGDQYEKTEINKNYKNKKNIKILRKRKKKNTPEKKEILKPLKIYLKTI
jgi:hypothetical protein